MDTVTELNIKIFFAQETRLMKSDTAIMQETREYGDEIFT